MFVVFFYCLLFWCLVSPQTYKLQATFAGDTFFDNFNFRNYESHGYAYYVNETTAYSMGLVNTSSNSIYIGADHTNKVTSTTQGRNSVRLESKEAYEQGLFIFSSSHMPEGCATWPAWWSYGPSWPNNGEIDIIEGVDLVTLNQMTLHTADSCDFTNAPKAQYSGTTTSTNCYNGCSIKSNDTTSYGSKFNSIGGGIIGMELDDNYGINIWWWIYENVPLDIINETPDPSSWGIPVASWNFGSWCPSSNFNNQTLTLNIDFCGWAGDSYEWDDSCSKSTGYNDCQTFVANEPQSFINAYWTIEYIKIFEKV